MNFKWKRVLFALIVGAGMTFTACSNDPEDVVPPSPDGPEGEKGYVALNLTTATALLTKAATTTFGEPEEAKVKNAFMALYDAKSLKLDYRIDLAVQSDGVSPFSGTSVSTNAAASTKSTFTTIAQNLVRKDYKLLIVLNPTTEMEAATKEKDNKYYKDFEDVKNQVVTNLGSLGTGGLMEFITMTNASGLINVSETMFWPKAVEAEKATNLPKVAVDRILAKVIFNTINPLVTLPAGAQFKNPTWQLDITNKKTYWVRRMTNTAPATDTGGGGGLATGDAGPHEDSLSSLLRLYVYAEDPNWDNLSLDRLKYKGDDLPQDSLTILGDNFNFLASDTTHGAFAHSLSSTSTHEYVLENTMAADEQWEDVTTRILIRGQYLPNGITGSYYFYAGAAFTHEDLYHMVQGSKPWPTTPSGLEAAITDSGFEFTANVEPADSKAGENKKINFYKDGINYYSILIRHFDDSYSEGDMNFGRYGVVRNNMYKVELKSVSGPGEPTIPEPEGPDDKKKSYISAFIEVLPWVVRNQEVDI